MQTCRYIVQSWNEKWENRTTADDLYIYLSSWCAWAESTLSAAREVDRRGYGGLSCYRWSPWTTVARIICPPGSSVPATSSPPWTPTTSSPWTLMLSTSQGCRRGGRAAGNGRLITSLMGNSRQSKKLRRYTFVLCWCWWKYMRAEIKVGWETTDWFGVA